MKPERDMPCKKLGKILVADAIERAFACCDFIGTATVAANDGAILVIDSEDGDVRAYIFQMVDGTVEVNYDAEHFDFSE